MSARTEPAGGCCPGCGAPLPSQAVLCVQCGYDTRTGRTVGQAQPWQAELEDAAPNPYRSPTADGIDSDAESSWLRELARLFSLRGRISRRYWWMVHAAFFVMELGFAALEFNDIDVDRDQPLLTLAILPVIWIMFATNVKRWHDLDRPGWWVLVNLVPLVGPLYSLIELGFERGTAGLNSYGEDPLPARVE